MQSVNCPLKLPTLHYATQLELQPDAAFEAQTPARHLVFEQVVYWFFSKSDKQRAS